MNDVGARRQLGENGRLGPAQEKRPDALRERVQAVGGFRPVAATLDRTAKSQPEGLLATKQTRHHELHHRPQLAQVILKRRAGQCNSMRCPQRPDRSRRTGARILDQVRLIGDDHLPALRLEHIAIARQ